MWHLRVELAAIHGCSGGNGHIELITSEGTLGIDPDRSSLEETLSREVARYVDQIANEILKYRPDLQVRPVMPPPGP